MEAIEDCNHLVRGSTVSDLPGLPIPDARRLDGHGVVWTMACKIALFSACLLSVGKAFEVRPPVEALVLPLLGKSQEPGFSSPLVQPVDGEDEICPPKTSPRAKWTLVEYVGCPA